MCADAKKKPESASSPPTLPVDAARDDGSASVHTVQQIEELSERMAALTNTNRQLKRKIFDLYTIFEISRNFNSVLDYETLLDTFILTALAQVGASRAAIFLPLEQWPDRFVQAKARGSGEFADAGRFFKAGSGLLTYMTSLNRPLSTGELIDSHAGRGEKDVLEHFHPGLVVPLMYQSNLTGIFIIADKMSNRKFEMDDIEFLSVLGSQISVAIENARLYSAEKMATRQLRAAQEQLVQTERAAALGEMSAKVAHEVNNPLGIIGNYLQLIRRVLGTNIEAINYVDIVSEEIDRIAGIVRQLLDFHRPGSEELAPVDVCRLVDSVLQLMDRQLAANNIELVKDLPTDCPPIFGVPENLKQVLLNIIINAVDFMPDGGRLEVAITASDHSLRVTFCDTGPGISPELIPRIFEPFFTTKEPGKGTGLGLSVCYGIIKRHGGSITYKNTETGGCFQIELPVGTEGDRSKYDQDC